MVALEIRYIFDIAIRCFKKRMLNLYTGSLPLLNLLMHFTACKCLEIIALIRVVPSGSDQNVVEDRVRNL